MYSVQKTQSIFQGQLEELDCSAGEGTTAFPMSLTTPTPAPTAASSQKQLTIQTANLNNDRNKPQLLCEVTLGQKIYRISRAKNVTKVAKYPNDS